MPTSLRLNYLNNDLLPLLYGARNRNLLLIEKLLHVRIAARGNQVVISGKRDSVKLATALLDAIYEKLTAGMVDIDEFEIRGTLATLSYVGAGGEVGDENVLSLQTKLRKIIPCNPSQERYVRALKAHDITFGVGVAGTGKTYLAVAMAVNMFLSGAVERIILSRPLVEAGEKLGFLPGDIKDKLDPYLQPLYDALYDMVPAEHIERYMATRELQIAPLAFMRGRTLNNAFVILDEAQNATIPQMKMFLTRLGRGSRMVITGDLTQIDLPSHIASGLVDAVSRFKNIPEIAIEAFESADVVRHALTKKIIEVYEK